MGSFIGVLIAERESQTSVPAAQLPNSCAHVSLLEGGPQDPGKPF